MVTMTDEITSSTLLLRNDPAKLRRAKQLQRELLETLGIEPTRRIADRPVALKSLWADLLVLAATADPDRAVLLMDAIHLFYVNQEAAVMVKAISDAQRLGIEVGMKNAERPESEVN